MEDPEIRLLVLSILTSLIDRRRNAARLAAARSFFFFFLWVKLGKDVQAVVGHGYLLKCTGTTLWWEDVTAADPSGHPLCVIRY